MRIPRRRRGAGVGRPIALLYESNTGYGQTTNQPKERGCPEIHYYPFPQNVARIRALYEKQDESGGASQFLPPSERLVPGSDGAKWPLDLIAPQTPEFTTPLDELVIDEILMDISHREIRTVGITATDARDVIFLAGKIRRMIPDARVFTTENDLVFTHPERIADLRGMFVASTYPLLARNQSWSYPYRGEQRSVFFTSDDAQGIYNATVLQLHDLLDEEPVAQTHFVEYGRPFALPGGTSPQGTSPETCPPVWIGVVGNHGIYPVHVDDGTPRDRDTTAAEQGQSEPDDIYHHQFKPVAGAASEDSVENAGTLFYPSFRRDWLLLFLGLSATCLGLAGVAFVQAAWSRRLRSSAEGLDLSKWPPFLRRVAVFLNWAPFLRRVAVFLNWAPFLRRVAVFLNWAPAEGWTKQGRFTGPGGFLLWALLYMSGVYFLTALPLFRIVPIAFIATDPGGWAFWLIGLAALVLLALVLGTIAAAAVWWRDRGRDASPRDGQPPRQAAPRTSRWRRAAAWLVRHGGAAFAAFLLIVGAVAVVLAAFLIVGAVVVALAGGVRGGNRPPKGDLTTDRIDALLALYRANALPSGVSPVFPLLFLGLAWLSWVFSRLYSRYVQEQATPPGPNLDGASRSSVLLDEAAWLEALRNRSEFEARCPRPGESSSGGARSSWPWCSPSMRSSWPVRSSGRASSARWTACGSSGASLPYSPWSSCA